MAATSQRQKRQEEPRVAQLQEALRRLLGNQSVTLETLHAGDTMQARIDGQVVGTIDEVTDEDEESWVLTVPVLADDLNQAGRAQGWDVTG